MTLGERIKICRKAKKMTQQQLGNELGISAAYIQQLELGQKTNPSYLIKLKINSIFKAHIYDVEADLNTTTQIKDITIFTTDELLKEIKRRIESEEK